MTARRHRLPHVAFPAPLLLAACLLLATGGGAVAATLEIVGPPGALVLVNDQDVGFLPLDGPFDAAPGYYTVTCELPGHVPFEQTVYIANENDHARVTIRLFPLRKRTAWTSSALFAGLGQFYLGHKTRGWVYAGTEAAGLLTALYGELERTNLRRDYLVIRDRYNSAINADEAVRLRGEMEAKYDDMESAEKMRDTGLLVALGAVTVSVVDALISFPNVEAGPGLVPIQTGRFDGPAAFSDLASLHAGVRMEF